MPIGSSEPRTFSPLPDPASVVLQEIERIPVSIVSHKTKFANYNDAGTNLRETALAWIKQHGFFDFSTYGISAGDVYFESTRAE